MVVTKALESTPENATHSSTRSMAKETVSRSRRVTDPAGVRSEAAPFEDVQAAPDPYFVGKVPDVVGLYPDPPERALVFCVDEKSQTQALDRFRPVLPMMPPRSTSPRRSDRLPASRFLIKLGEGVPDTLGVHLSGPSGLNLVERRIAEPTSRRIRRGVRRTVQALEKDIRNRFAAWTPT